MSLTVLNIAYPPAPVGADAAGGAEQVLHQLDAGLARAEHRSLVIACAGSEASGTLLAVPAPPATIDAAAWREAHEACWRRIAEALSRWPVDVIHCHGIGFEHYLPPSGVPVLATLHLPLSWYAPSIFRLGRPHTYLNCVSEAQRRACLPGAVMLPVIPNGVPIGALAARRVKRRSAFGLGRICLEKGFHLALDAARRGGTALLLTGAVFGYAAHRQYFRTEIVPRLDRARRFIGPVGFPRKHRLLAAARCLTVASVVPETNSLVAMEALASGAPVVAFPVGALPDIVKHGRTGYLVRDVEEMADAMQAAPRLSPEECCDAACRRFSAAAMVERYIAIYHALPRGQLAKAAVGPLTCWRTKRGRRPRIEPGGRVLIENSLTKNIE